MKQIIAIIIAFAMIFFSLPVMAAEPTSSDVSLGAAGLTLGKVSPLEKGERAPFDGVLLDPAAAAKLMVDQQEADNKCQIEINKHVETEKAKLQLDLANMKASRDALKKELAIRMSIKDEHIKFLENDAVKNAKKSQNSVWWFMGGLAGGILLSIGAAFIIREARGTQQPIIVNTGN